METVVAFLRQVLCRSVIEVGVKLKTAVVAGRLLCAAVMCRDSATYFMNHGFESDHGKEPYGERNNACQRENYQLYESLLLLWPQKSQSHHRRVTKASCGLSVINGIIRKMLSLESVAELLLGNKLLNIS